MKNETQSPHKITLEDIERNESQTLQNEADNERNMKPLEKLASIVWSIFTTLSCSILVCIFFPFSEGLMAILLVFWAVKIKEMIGTIRNSRQ